MTEPYAQECNHGITFEPDETRKLLGDWQQKNNFEWLRGNPAHAKIRRMWPRLFGKCPLGCGYNGIYYASWEHYIMGDW